jgi:hypothetical protein
LADSGGAQKDARLTAAKRHDNGVESTDRTSRGDIVIKQTSMTGLVAAASMAQIQTRSSSSKDAE